MVNKKEHKVDERGDEEKLEVPRDHPGILDNPQYTPEDDVGKRGEDKSGIDGNSAV